MSAPATRRAALVAFSAAGAACALGPGVGAQPAPDARPAADVRPPAGEAIVVGVSGPLTGQYAHYGAQWRKAYDLVLDEVNAGGGLSGRPLAYRFEDTQSDPRQAVAVARRLVGDPRVCMELGDFSSVASMAASPVYQAAGMVQFGFNNSHRDFTAGGDHMWSSAPNQDEDAAQLADFAVSVLGFRRLAVLSVNDEWGRSSRGTFVKALGARGAAVVASEGYLADDKDIRGAAVGRARDAGPDAIVLMSYYLDGAAIARAIRAAGIAVPIVACGPVYSPKFLELAGPAAEGVFTLVSFFPGDPRPAVQAFDAAFRARYGSDPDSPAAHAYDAMRFAAEVIRRFGPERAAIQDGFMRIRDVPSVVHGRMSFNPATRRVEDPVAIRLVVRGGAFVVWNGPPT